MNRYVLELCYDGTGYHGWQVQPNGLSLQQVVQTAIVNLTGQPANVTGCSRTDAGVHARQFFCHVDTPVTIPPEGFKKGLNCGLPGDIRVLSCRRAEPDFHARYNARYKTYEYCIDTGEVLSPFRRRYAYHCPQSLDTDAMKRFCAALIGTHDFIGFSSSGRSVNDTVRTVYDCRILNSEHGLVFRITANGFLYNMVRILAGTAVAFGTGRFDSASAEELLASRDRSRAGQTLPGCGLYLCEVSYKEFDYASLSKDEAAP